MTSEVTHHAAETSSAHGGIPELPNVITLLSQRFHDQPLVAWLHHWENLVFAVIVGLGLSFLAWRYAREPKTIPHGWQNLLELIVDGVDQFIRRVMGPAGREHVPFLGTLFLYIWLMNLSALVPGMKSSTSSLNTTVGLAVAVFVYVQWVRLTTLGPLRYLDHLAGSPRFDDVKAAPIILKPMLLVIKLFVMIVLLVLELVGEIIKPASLSLRLGFNVFAEDVLLAVLVGLGITAGLALHLPIGVPIQLFVVPLVLIFSTVQALVFSLLSSVYIALMLPHGEHGEHH